MFRIERVPGVGGATTLVITGHLCASARDEVARAVEGAFAEAAAVRLDLRDVTCVDRQFVRYLADTVSGAVSIAGCPSYLTRWIAQEQATRDHSPRAGNT